MKRRLALYCFLIVFAIPLNGQTPAESGRDFTVDLPESKAEFSIISSVGEINGVFKSLTGRLHEATSGVPESTTLRLEVAAATMSTGNGVKDEIVRGKDFFDVQNHPTVAFTSTRVIPSKDPDKFQVQGDFTLRGVTKPVTLQVTFDRDTKDGGHIYADLSFDRRDFGMTKNMPFAKVSDSVKVRLDLHAVADRAAPAVDTYSWTKVVRIKVGN
jgi:polyisoprenoid-binding protein YceI